MISVPVRVVTEAESCDVCGNSSTCSLLLSHTGASPSAPAHLLQPLPAITAKGMQHVVLTGRGLSLPSLCSLSALQELQLDPDPGVRRAALETLEVLDSCSQHGLLASPQGMS